MKMLICFCLKYLVCHPVADLFAAAFADVPVVAVVVSWNL
jgi:hypothetical protein